MEGTNDQPGTMPPEGGPQGNMTSPIPNFSNKADTPGPAGLPPALPSTPPVGGAPEPAPPPTPPPTPPSPEPPAPPMPEPPRGGTPVSLPPPKQVDIRTMVSDQESLKASGGISIAPQAAKPTGKGMRKVDSAGRPPGGGGKKKALLMGLGIVVFLATAALVTNYFVLPIFLSDTELAEPPAVEDTQPPEGATVTPTVPTFIHTSYFEEPVDGGSVEVNVNAINRTNITAALQQTAANRALEQEGAITEFYLTQGLTGAPIEGEEVLAAVLPDVQFVADMDEDFTGFMYSDGTDIHPGYVFALDTTDLASVRASFRDTFESSEALGNFFLSNPGVPSETGFKDGMAIETGSNSRWITFEDGESSLDYGFKGPFVVVSTSFDGFKATLNKLGDIVPGSEAEAPTDDTTIGT